MSFTSRVFLHLVPKVLTPVEQPRLQKNKQVRKLGRLFKQYYTLFSCQRVFENYDLLKVIMSHISCESADLGPESHFRSTWDRVTAICRAIFNFSTHTRLFEFWKQFICGSPIRRIIIHLIKKTNTIIANTILSSIIFKIKIEQKITQTTRTILNLW